MRIIVRLQILSSLVSPQEISSCLGLEPTKYWRKGETDRRRASLNMSKLNGWIFEPPCPSNAHVEQRLELLVERLHPGADEIRRLARSEQVMISLVTYSITPVSFFLDKTLLHKIASLGVDFDVQSYEVEAENPESLLQ